MPLREFACPAHGIFERFLWSSEDKSSARCDCGKLSKAVVSLTNFRFGGVEGKARQAANAQKRNDAYNKSSRGIEEHKANTLAALKRVHKGRM